ncbi:hypothetical protein NON20_03755 [Synechocystis sp. B12]|nr:MULTISPECIES: hypothetical protein [unclassified Synechocystis]WLT38875.1 hypothetical protein NON20_03755 [Synechocystis sp. B12]
MGQNLQSVLAIANGQQNSPSVKDDHLAPLQFFIEKLRKTYG